MKLGFICLDLPGHLNPMTALARQLQARNHEVVFLYSSGAAGLPFVPSPEKDHINEKLPEISKKEGQDALQFSFRAVLTQTEAILKSLPAIVQANGIDALIIDIVQFYAELGALQLGMPYVHVSTGVHHDFSGYTPLCLYGWPHETTPAALARNREGVAKWASLLESINEGIKAHARSVGLNIDWNDLSSTVSPFALITQVPRAFDFESSHWPSQFHHTGPFHNGKGREKVDFPWEKLTGEPLVYASMGTILNGQVDVFRTIVAAVAKHKNLQLVLSTGDQVDPKQIGPAPNNAIIAKRVPQLELLKQTTVCITHAGLNTVLESLAQGVPQLAIPVTYDQPGVAARIAHKRTGVVTSLDKLTADHLAFLLEEVLTNLTYRENARKLQKAITGANGLSVAADLIEESLGAPTKLPAKLGYEASGVRARESDGEVYAHPAEALDYDFNLSKLERVMSGAGKVAALGHELERRGLKRTIVVTGKTLGGSALLEKVTGAAGARCVAVFKGARQHVPRSSVHELQALIERENADSLIGFGGGSPIDTCKVASHPFLEKREIIQIAIPTTLSAAEYTYGCGVTDEKTLVKSSISDPRLQPRTVINDPELTLETPEWLWVATGMRALDHAIETIYAKRHHPLSDALGAKAISLLVEHLKPSIETSTAEQLAHRGECQFAAWFSIFGSMNTRFGISHLLGHQIGPRWNIAHGITSCITLPHAMRFMAGIAPERFGPIAEGFGIPFDRANLKASALACADRTAQFIASFDVPHSLKDVGVSRNEIQQIVPAVLHEVKERAVVDKPITEAEVLALLEASH